MITRSDVTVELIRAEVSDDFVVQAARVSTVGENAGTDGEKLIPYLMRNRHGSPFEHGSMTFRIEAPIFVFREFHRHRIGWSYNEESARYKEMEPVFYVPDTGRRIVQEGKPGAYKYVHGTPEQYQLTHDLLKGVAYTAYEAYQEMLKNGVAREVARMCLPVNLFSSMYATCNPRSLMAFLSLRTQREHALFTSTPMQEIDMVASKMESLWASLMPITWQAYEDAGRVAP